MSFGDSVPLNPLARTPAPPGSYLSDDDKTPAFIRRKSVAVTGLTLDIEEEQEKPATESTFDPTFEFPHMDQQKAGPSGSRGKPPQGQDPKTPERQPKQEGEKLPTTSETTKSGNPNPGDEPSDDDDDRYNPRPDPSRRSANAPRPQKGTTERKNLPIPKLDKLEGANDF